ncbi:MAG: hypothetical protein ACO3AV_06255 [Ilumatobacteraceae bacterium]
MTIRKGEEWGERLPLPRGLPSADTDAVAGRWFDSAPPGAAERGLVLHGGDLARTLGSVESPKPGEEATRAVIDVMALATNAGETRTAVAHVVIRAGASGHGWWRHRGRIVMVMNAQFIGDADPTPRCHPSDGRADLLDLSASMGFRARRQVRSRLRTGSHLPHPLLQVSSASTHSIEFEGPCTVLVDGEVWFHRRTGVRLAVRIVPDAVVVWT